jgi:hypothetical protein
MGLSALPLSVCFFVVASLETRAQNVAAPQRQMKADRLFGIISARGLSAPHAVRM